MLNTSPYRAILDGKTNTFVPFSSASACPPTGPPASVEPDTDYDDYFLPGLPPHSDLSFTSPTTYSDAALRAASQRGCSKKQFSHLMALSEELRIASEVQERAQVGSA